MHLKTLLFTFLLSSLVSGCGGESSPSSQSNGNGNKPTTPGTQKPTKPTQPEHQVSAQVDVSRDGQATLNVLDNDFDANGPLSGGTIKIHSVDTRSLAYGNISWHSNGKVTYQAPKGFVGDDHFHYTIIDDTGMKDESEVHVKVISDSRVAFLRKVTLLATPI